MMNFFVTGDGSVKENINLKFVTPAGSHGANFAADGQSLQQSLSIAREVFSRVERGKIDFVLIGLAPDVLFQGGSVDENLSALTEYVKLCVQSGSKPVCVLFPVAPTVRELYRQKFVTPLREILSALKNLFDFELVDLFDVPFLEECFFDERHFNSNAAPLMNAILTYKLCEQKIFTFAELRRMSYYNFYELSSASTAEVFHTQMNELFRATVDELKRKDRIKVAFVTDHAAVWCGDKLYNMFANNPRFEPTIFLCHSLESTLDDIRHDFEQFKSRGLNVVGVFNLDEETEPQDVVIFLRPYDFFLSKSFQFSTLTPQTLLTYIHYSYETTTLETTTLSSYYNYPIFRLTWKSFFDTDLTRKLFNESCKIGMPRAYASGLPKMDFFFDAAKSSFPWKMVRPNAKKIIWAPHWTIFDIENFNSYGTFQHNYKFMYEFAKNHPETSWVVKPHPRLALSVVNSELFPSYRAFAEYLQAWNELPNAQVYTGAYYQDIFATSDGMIHDSCSFIAEYQFTHKPMIFLTRDKPAKFTDLGRRILDVSYCVNGSDFDGIAALMQKVFIEGDDPLKDARRKVFDDILDYRRVNGMSASEYIFQAIADELTGD